MPAVGIDVSDRSIRFAELKHGKGAFVLGKFGEKFIPPGIVTGGEIRKQEEMRKILTDLKKELDFLYVRVSFPEQLGYSLKIRIPKVARKDIYESLELQLEEHVPLSPQEAVFDYEIVTCGTKAEDSLYEIGLSVMPQKVIQSYVSMFEHTGLIPLSFEFEAHAIARSLVREDDCGTFLLLDIGATRTGLAIISRGVITFTSTINIGGYSLTESVAKALNVSFKEAERLKEERGLLDGKEDLLYQVLLARLSVLRDEILKHYIYARTHENIIEKGSAVERIIICGGEANVPGLPNYLATTLETDIEIANPWVNINSLNEYVPEIPSNHALRYATALGLALNTLS
ncbi:MAG: pilus assembly protein PilM [bacterium]|nr:pilus assembly protein PilM [bacterium]